MVKNRKKVSFYYKGKDQEHYTIHLSFNNELYQIHYYAFAGDDVFDDGSYKNEHIIEESDFNNIMKVILECFPGLIESS